MDFSLTLGVANLEKTESFYRELLAMSPEHIHDPRGETVCLLLSCGSQRITFLPLPVMERQHPALLQNLSRSPLGVGMQLEFSCDCLDEVIRRAKQRRWPIAYELEDCEHGRRELWLHDPDGYLVILNEELGTLG